jgi:hypothetical protein
MVRRKMFGMKKCIQTFNGVDPSYEELAKFIIIEQYCGSFWRGM